MSEFKPSQFPEPGLARFEGWEADLESEAIARFPELLHELRAKHERAVETMLDDSLVRRAQSKLAISERISAEIPVSGSGEEGSPLSAGIDRDSDISTYIDYRNRIEQSVYESAGLIKGFGLQYTDPGLCMVRLKPRIVNQSQALHQIEYIDCRARARELHVDAYTHKPETGRTAIPLSSPPEISAVEVVGLLCNAHHSYDQLLAIEASD